MNRTLFFVFRGKRLLNWAIGLFLVGLVIGLSYRPVRQVSVNLSAAVSGKVVMLDPGHGGPDPGAVRYGNIEEKEVVLAIARKLQPMLQRAAIYAPMTRTTDSDLADEGIRGFSSRKRADLSARVQMANEQKVDVFISIHANAFPESKWSGAQTFYFPGQEESKELAVAIQTELVKRLGPNNRKARPGAYWVLRKTRMPAVVVEVGFLSNPREASLLATPSYQERVAEAIFFGIVRYFAQEYAEEKEQSSKDSGNE